MSSKAPRERRFCKEVVMLSKYLLIGTVLKPQGIHGQVKIKPLTDSAQRFLALKEVLVSKNEGAEKVPERIEGISVREDFVYAHLAASSSRNEAEAQRGWMLYVRREDAVELDEDQNFIADLIGCRVLDSKGNELGKLKEVLQPGANDVYVIALHQGGTMLLPALKRVIPSVDAEQGIITVDETILDEVAVIED